MGEALRPREITPERQPLVARDTHNLPDRPCRMAETPLSKAGDGVSPACSVGTQKPRTRLAFGLRVIGPSVADRGAFSVPAQGGSLLASNGAITEPRPPGIGRPRTVHPWAGADRDVEGHNRTEDWPGLTPSNSGRDYQVLVKRGHCGAFAAKFSLGHHKPQRLGTGQRTAHEGPDVRAPPRVIGRASDHHRTGQKSTRASCVRAAVTRGSSEPTTSRSSSSRTRAASRSSPAVRRTASMSRPKASST